MRRIKKVQELLEKEHLDALIVDLPIDLFYLTGLTLSLGRLWIDRKQAILFVDGRYFEVCQKQAMCQVELSQGFDKDSRFAAFSCEIRKDAKIGFDTAISYQSYEKLTELFKAVLHPLSEPIKKLRQIKEESEIEKLRKAAELCGRGYDYLVTLLKEGVSEKELAFQLERYWKEHGGDKLAFEPIIAFGPHASLPHHRVTTKRLENDQIVLIDIGVSLEGYASDMTRVVFFGKEHAELRKIYNVVEQAKNQALAICKPGIYACDVDQAARSYIEEAGYGNAFSHSLGHGIGLEVHELPVLKKGISTPLAPGMAFTIEPGIYVPGLGGVRLEDTVVLTAHGIENLTMGALKQ